MKSEFKGDFKSISGHCDPKESFPPILPLVLKGELDLAKKIINQMQKCFSKKTGAKTTTETSFMFSSTKGLVNSQLYISATWLYVEFIYSNDRQCYCFRWCNNQDNIPKCIHKP